MCLQVRFVTNVKFRTNYRLIWIKNNFIGDSDVGNNILWRRILISTSVFSFNKVLLLSGYPGWWIYIDKLNPGWPGAAFESSEIPPKRKLILIGNCIEARRLVKTGQPGKPGSCKQNLNGLRTTLVYKLCRTQQITHLYSKDKSY